MAPSVFWNCPGYFCYSIYLMSGHICYIPFSLELDSRCEVVIPHSKWVGSGRVTLRHVSPIPPLDPYVRLSPHTAHDRGILWERSISPAPRCIPHGQLCAFAGYLCTVSLPSPSGPSPCARFSRTRTTMPYLTACWALEFRMGFPSPTLHPP